MTERDSGQPTLAAAMRNWEIYWQKRPMNEHRTYLGLAPVGPEEFRAEVELERNRVVEIAQAQREAWGKEEHDRNR